MHICVVPRLAGGLRRGAIAAACSIAGALGAQQPPDASIRGVAFDSLRGKPMAGAFIELRPAGRQTMADSAGRFSFDAVPAPATFFLRIMYGVLDTVGIGLTTPEFRTAPAQISQVDVGVPSAPALIEVLCGPRRPNRGFAALAGVIRDPVSGAPVGGASISFEYDDAPVSVVRLPVVRSVRSDPLGHYVICGLPERMQGTLRFEKREVGAVEIPVLLDTASLLTVRAVALAKSARAHSGEDTVRVESGTGVLVGRLRTTTGGPVADARIQLTGTGSATTSLADGSFRLDSLPFGTRSILVRKIGFAAVEWPVEVGPYATGTITVEMAPAAQPLAAMVTISERQKDLDGIGFTRRRQQGFGFLVEGEKLDRGAHSLGEALRMVPGLRIGYDAANTREQKAIVMGSRDSRSCLRYVVDGVYWQEIGGDLDRLIGPQDLEAIEMYNPGTVPGEFAAASRGKCAVLVLWTRLKVRPARLR